MMFARLCWYFSTMGPVGFLPAPGTCGTLVTLVAFYWINQWLSAWQQIAVIVGFFVIALIAVTVAQNAYDVHDPKEIVIDELLGSLVAVCGLPVRPELYIMAFVLFRFFDIAKPLFIGTCEQLPGAFGVIVDDIAAGAVSWLILVAIVRYFYGDCA